jgi:hypothetical protein
VRIVIVGIGKSGTTALLYAVHAAMPSQTPVIFEPRTSFAVTSPDVAAKILIDPRFPMEAGVFHQFDRIVLLVRDPRDIFVSKALYRTRGSVAMQSDPGKLAQYVALLREKEADPRAVPLARINALFDALTEAATTADEAMVQLLDGVVAFHQSFPQAFVYKYESMVAGDFHALGQHLALDPASLVPRVPAELQRVVRTRRAGNWRDWLTPEDVAHYRPMFAPFMARYGYPDEWALNDRPAIHADECSEYVLMLDRERRGIATPAA